MRLCLSCYRLWPRGALFCGVCGRSFGGRVCKRRHLSPPGARVCVHCGETELTEPTGYLALGWASGLLSAVVLLLGAAWLLPHLGQAFGGLAAGADWLLEHLFGQPSRALERGGSALLQGGILLGLVLLALPPRLRTSVCRSLGNARRSLWRFLYRVLVLGLLRAISRGVRK